MKWLNDIQNNTIIICENSYKKYILKFMTKNKLFLNVKFFTKKEFFKEYFFDYHEQALYFLIKKYHFKIEVAQMYLKNIYFIDDLKSYKSAKLTYLKNLKKELIDEHLLIFNPEFKEYLKGFDIIVLGYPYLDAMEENLFQNLKAKIYNPESQYNIKEILQFNTIEEEINFVLKQICNLITKGININDIKIVGLTEEYYNDLTRLSKFYNIPIKIPVQNSLYSNLLGQRFLNNLVDNLNDAIESLKDENIDIRNKIIEICNKYTFVNDIKLLKKFIIYEFKNTYFDNYNEKNYVELLDLEDCLAEENYIFLMNFNSGIFPKIIKDEEYITDNIKNEVNMLNTAHINKKLKAFTIQKIQSLKHLWITYKLKDYKREYYASPLVNDLKAIITSPLNDLSLSYSQLNDKINYAKAEYNYEKYGDITNALFVYSHNLGDIKYKTYDNKYKKINKDGLKKYLNGKLTLSYSSLNNFNKCSFRFYVANILKLDKYEETFETFIGSIFHDVLEKCLKENSHVELEVTNYIKKKGKILTIKEQFFIQKIIQDIKFVIQAINNQKEYIRLDKELHEENITVSLTKDFPVEFVGIIDKILYHEENNQTLISVIDYKTGNVNIDLNYVPYGLSLQLPIYLYLVKKSNIFVNPKFVGFYLQHILDNDILRDNKTSYAEQKWNNLKLRGYSNDNIHDLVWLDSSYENSNIIKGLKVKNDGQFTKNAKVLNENQINTLIALTEKNILEGVAKILEADFTINPKKIGFDKDLGCQYCRFKDLCFKKEDDYVILEEINSLNFLGGDDNAKLD